ncbi:MAG TPA: DUF3761 domain-containing protein [Pyrinomonadaceae bacterium]|jgi:hypothetical protein|nr:DUF3761 domain-containing protein [Pyrinomonadaceae bacterium]
MKRLIFSLFFILVFSLFIFSQSAEIITEKANLRGTASQSGRVVTTLGCGTQIEVIKRAGSWFLAQSTEYVGWIHGNTIQFTSAYSTTPCLASQTTYTVLPAPTYQVVPAPTYTIEPVKIYQPEIATERPRTTEPSVTPSAPAIAAPAAAPEPASAVPTAICNDGTYSYSLNHSGTCSHHGGVSSWLDGSTPSPARPTDTSNSSSGGTVQVRGYYRKDGTYVQPHTRSAPRKKP